MKHLALLVTAGSLAIFAAPAQAADLSAGPASALAFADFSHSAPVFAPLAAYGDDDDYRHDRRRWRGRGHDDRRYRDRDHDRYDGRRLSRNDRVWRGNDGRYRCRRGDGTVGLVIGAGAGALLGREIDSRGDRALGTILGAVGGGLLGREVDRGGARCR